MPTRDARGFISTIIYCVIRAVMKIKMYSFDDAIMKNDSYIINMYDVFANRWWRFNRVHVPNSRIFHARTKLNVNFNTTFSTQKNFSFPKHKVCKYTAGISRIFGFTS